MEKFIVARVFNYRVNNVLTESEWLKVLILEEALKERKALDEEQSNLLQSILDLPYSDADKRVWKVLQEREAEARWERSQRDWR